MVVVGKPFTVWLIVEDVLAAKEASLPYVAVTVWGPGARSELENVTTPLRPLSAVEPRTLVPSATNWTLPVGVPAPGAVTVTVAVKTTDWPGADGFGAELRPVAVPALVTVWMTVPVLMS